MVTVEQLRDIEEIKQLKAMYIYYGDAKNWEKWGELFTDDYEIDMAGIPRGSKDAPDHAHMKGLKTILAAWDSLVTNIKTAHHAILPVITFTSPTAAHGLWVLNEEVWMPTCHFKGWGHYHEDYVKVGGVWKISKTVTTRLRVEENWL